MASTEKLPSGKYRGVFRDSSGKKRHTNPFDRKSDAREAAVDAEAKARRQSAAREGTVSASITWGEWWAIVEVDRAFESDAGRTEQQLVRGYVLPRWEDIPLNKIEQRDIQQWVRELERGKAPVNMVAPRFERRPLSASYVQRVYSPFRVSITKAIDDGVLSASPCAGVKLPKRQKKPKAYMTTGEASKLGAELRQDYRDAVQFLLETGLRPGELTGMHSHRIDLDDAVLTVAETYVFRAKKIRPWPKNRNARKVPLSAKAVEIARRRLAGRDTRQACGVEHMRGEKCTHQLVFITDLGRPLNRDTLNFHLRKAADAANLEAKSGYSLRRGTATRFAEGGLDVFTMADVMGWSDIKMAQEYVQQTASVRSRVLAALGDRPALAAVEDVGQRGTARGTDLGNQSLPAVPGEEGEQVV